MRFTTVAVATSAMLALLVPLQLAAQVVDGSGTTNVVPLWIDSNTLGNSHISDTGGVITATSTNGAQVVISGDGIMHGRRGFSGGGAMGGAGGSIQATGGSGVRCYIPASTRCAIYRGGNGGSITVQPGAGGVGETYNGFTYPGGHFGVLLLAPSGGNVGIGLSTPGRTLEVKIGGTTLADNWTIRSSRRFKTNIQPLQDALGRIEALQGVSYERTSDGQHEIGVVAEDVDRVVPEVVAHDPETHEVEGVDYSRLVALLIEAVKSQQAEIKRLTAQMAQLTSNATK
jgi:endosialidase-like protein